MRLLLLLIVTGCGHVTPYASYQHYSDPRVSGDGNDVACGGGKAYIDRLTVKAGWCESLRGYDPYAEAGFEYDFMDTRR